MKKTIYVVLVFAVIVVSMLKISYAENENDQNRIEKSRNSTIQQDSKNERDDGWDLSRDFNGNGSNDAVVAETTTPIILPNNNIVKTNAINEINTSEIKDTQNLINETETNIKKLEQNLSQIDNNMGNQNNNQNQDNLKGIAAEIQSTAQYNLNNSNSIIQTSVPIDQGNIFMRLLELLGIVRR